MSHEVTDFLDYIDFDLVCREKILHPNLVGYYETKNLVSSVDDSLDMLFCFFERLIQSSKLMCSLTDYVAHVEYWTQEEKGSIKKFEEQGWLIRGRGSEDVYNFSAHKIDFSLLSLLRSLFKLDIQGHTYGLCYLYWEKEGLALYPTKDEGFGFIAKDNTTGYDLAMQFLTAVDKRKFNVTLLNKAI
jgi:hypothetical protein